MAVEKNEKTDGKIEKKKRFFSKPSKHYFHVKGRSLGHLEFFFFFVFFLGGGH